MAAQRKLDWFCIPLCLPGSVIFFCNVHPHVWENFAVEIDKYLAHVLGLDEQCVLFIALGKS